MSYSDEEDIDIRIRHGPAYSRPYRYVDRPRNQYDGVTAIPSYPVAEPYTTTIVRPQSRERSRNAPLSRSPPALAPGHQVIINNRIYNEYSSDDEGDYHRQRQVAHRRPNSTSRSASRPRLTRDEWEADLARRELENLRLENANDRDERRAIKEIRTQAELHRAKRELDEIKRRESRAGEEKRLKEELELKRLREEEHAAEEKKLREKEAVAAVELYKKKEVERLATEKARKENEENEYRRRMQEDLLKSGLDEKAIVAILEKKKIPEASESSKRPTYTRMARRHLSIETLRAFDIEFNIDPDPDYILIKRWVPEWEQDRFWRHTKQVRERRTGVLYVEEKRHRRAEPEFEWVRKKHDRKRSKSPGGLLMYLAGARST